MKCHEFLKDYEIRKERYARAEQMYLELLRMRNKSIDVAGLREKHNLLDDSGDDFEVSACESQQFITVIEHIVEEETPPEVAIPMEPNKIEESRLAEKDIVIEKTTAAPKLLNPTIHPKIINLNRMELLKCDLCSNTTSTKLSMNRHMKQVHMKKSSKSFACKTCSKTFAKKIVLRTHEKIHLEQRPTFECPHCGKCLSSQTAVSNHIKWLHKENREFSCENCSKMFATVSLTFIFNILADNKMFFSERISQRTREDSFRCQRSHLSNLPKNLQNSKHTVATS